jgi:hypothetical protein
MRTTEAPVVVPRRHWLTALRLRGCVPQSPFEVGDEVHFFHTNKVVEGMVLDIGWVSASQGGCGGCTQLRGRALLGSCTRPWPLGRCSYRGARSGSSAVKQLKRRSGAGRGCARRGVPAVRAP